MRILFTSSPGLGHIHPMVPLAVALAGRGHEVRWAVAPEAQPWVEAAGFATFPAGIGVGPRQAEFARRHPEVLALPPAQRPERMFPAIFGEIAAPPMLDDLRSVMERWAPSLVVHDAAELAGPVAAAVAGVPNVAHSFGALLPAPRVAAAAEAIAGLWQSAGLEPRPYAGCYDHLYLDIYPPSMRPGGDGHVHRIQALRPVPLPEGEAPPAPARRPLVYLTFGTVFNEVGEAFRNAVEGVARLDVDVLVTVGPAADPGALGPVPANVRVEQYVPQTSVLPACAAVVSHAGSGTFLATLGFGIPQLCLPQAADQFINAAQGAASGAALTLLPGDASADAVQAATARLLGDPAIVAAARRVQAEIAAMPSPDDVAGALESLV
jgi:UDP:flavonoid glycosyltransferase YjiC (YdhE family)